MAAPIAAQRPAARAKPVPHPAAPVAAAEPPSHAWPDTAWREIGPASIGGRVDDIEAVASDPRIIFVGTASGGVFRSTDNGVTWDHTFDAYGATLSIGDIAIAPSDPNVVWVGTGEANNRQSSTWGDGVYRSLDGGTTWEHKGLRDTQSIGRVVIDPRDPSTVFVAAAGHLFGPN
ncbi:MAG: WD40/YVTN/BNR-like repeat-containing protein, partial [Gemmatimonadaceae bacterium]